MSSEVYAPFVHRTASKGWTCTFGDPSYEQVPDQAVCSTTEFVNCREQPMPIDLSALHLPPGLIAQITASTGPKTTISGSAVASGDSSRITGGITVATTDDGPVTSVSGEATVTATAQSSDGEAMVSTTTDVDVEGEDVLEAATENSYNIEQSGDLVTTTATSTTTLFALDKEEADLPTDTITTDPAAEVEETSDEATINGNALTFTFDIAADGGDTYVGFETTLLANDEVSSLSVTAFSIA
jgi:hypothetical protein